jgi:hypothetical protein
VTLEEANAVIELYHRHHAPDVGHKFSLCVVDESGGVRGVAIVGRPKARALDSGRGGLVAEVCRVCTRGTKNVCSMLYGASARICREMGYREIVTYVLETESGTSLLASGWECDGVVRPDGRGWNSRPNRQSKNQETKVRWRKRLQP